jgi:hypothetical protein
MVFRAEMAGDNNGPMDKRENGSFCRSKVKGTRVKRQKVVFHQIGASRTVADGFQIIESLSDSFSNMPF